jgi:hypothetical protein
MMRLQNITSRERHAGDASATKRPRWELVLHENGSQEWSWRRIGEDGSIEHASRSYPDFGLAMGDAVKNGLCAQEEDWVIKTHRWTTHFPAGKTPFSIRAERGDPAFPRR